MNEQMKPCPNPECGGDAACLKSERFYLCGCTNANCVACGPSASSAQSAVAAWNALPRALVWTTEPPQLSAWNWWRLDAEERPVCRYVYSDGTIDNKIIGRIACQDIGGQWCPIPEPQEPRP